MIVLTFPQVKDAASLRRILQEPYWSPHSAKWSNAYENYAKVGGDPWRLAPAGFNKEESEKQHDLFKNRSRRGGPLGRIRSMAGLKCCPMCGSPMTGTLDHYLPKEEYPEFSIYSRNLVPACSACNSGSKRQTYKGAATPERFLHPYFDALASKPIWKVSVRPPFTAPGFVAEALSSLNSTERQQVEFHLKHILGEQFQLLVERNFAELPQRLRDVTEGEAILDFAGAEMGLRRLLRDEITTGSVNCWAAALFRGVLEDARLIVHLMDKANALQVTPIA